jgi:hypothetical protein
MKALVVMKVKLHAFLISAFDECDQLVFHSDCFISGGTMKYGAAVMPLLSCRYLLKI